MANLEAGTTQASGGEYQVFLSFRGPDTRHGFTDFLFRTLKNSGFSVFRDDEELRVGDVIGGNLLCAINNSIIYIPIFSGTYAISKWCLHELAHIVDNVSRSGGKKSILPIFFHIEPKDVKLGTPLYSDALLEHAKKFPDEVEVWRAALVEVGRIKGWNVKKDQSQGEIVESVVSKVLEKLETKQKKVPRHLVRLNAQVNHLIESLDMNQCDVRVIAIYGMGGIGKTTVAKIIFNELSSHFGSRCSFLEDVRENSSTKEGIVQLQKKLLSDIIGSTFAKQVKDSEQGMKMIGEVLCTKEVLLVLDDVAEEQHIENLIGNYSLCLRSRIIITTRDKTIPPNEGFNGEIQRYEMLEMDAPLALQLFCRHSFGKDFPPNDYCWLSNEIVFSIGGLPLAVEVIGSSLKGRGKAVWEETLVNLKNVPKEKILKKLKISYDGLEKNQKNIFLDIACFFFNEKKTNPIYMWGHCNMNPLGGIEVLIDRCLIKVLDDDKFWMHDQLIALGREIVREDSLDELRKQSRLWIAEEALEVIRIKERKDMVQALDMNGLDDSIEITYREFKRLQNLRFLKLHNGTYVGDFANCRSKLKWISWHCPHQDFRANNMYLDHLVVFELGTNGFTDDSKAWDLIKRAQNLRVISLMECDGITKIPDFSKCLGLERLTLARCNGIKQIKSFIGHLQSLISLDIKWCIGLTDLPEEVGTLAKLKHFSLQGCSGLCELPSSLGNLTSLIELDLSGTGIGKANLILGCNLSFLANKKGCNLRWIGRLSRLKKLDLNLPNIIVLPEFASLSHLEELTMSKQCVEFKKLPPSLKYLHIRMWTSLGESIGRFQGLVFRSDLRDSKDVKKALKIVSRIAGVHAIDLNIKDQRLVVTGDLDCVKIVNTLREMYNTDIVWIGQDEQRSRVDPRPTLDSGLGPVPKGIWLVLDPKILEPTPCGLVLSLKSFWSVQPWTNPIYYIILFIIILYIQNLSKISVILYHIKMFYQ